MASTYTVNLGIEKIGTGEQSGTWGNTTNTNFDLIDQAVNGAVTVTLASAGTSGSPNTLAITDGASSDGRNKFIEFADGADLGATAYIQLTPNDAEKIVHMRNSLSGGRSVIVFQGTYNASNDFEIPNGKDVVLKFDGAGASATVTDVFTDLQATAITTPDLTATTADINGGTIDGATLGGSSQVTITDADMNGGTIDGVVIGGASAAAGSFTTGQFDTSLNVDGTVTANGLTVDAGGSSAILIQNAQPGLVFDDNSAVGAGSDKFIIRSAAGQSLGDYELVMNNDQTSSSDVTVAKFHGNSDISFYEDTGTNARIVYDASTAFIVNEDGADFDFRVESDTNTHMLFVDAGDNVVNIGTSGLSTVGAKLAVQGPAAFNTDSGTNKIYITRSGATNQAGSFYVDDATFVFDSQQDEAGLANGGFLFRSTNAANSDVELLSLNQSNSVFNEGGADADFRVESDASTHMLFVDAGANTVAINSSSPDATFDVNGSLKHRYLRPEAPSSHSAAADVWWQWGTITFSGSQTVKLTVQGTQSYSAGGSIAGETEIFLRGNNGLTTLEGYFAGKSMGNVPVYGVAWKNTGTNNEFLIYLRLSTFQAFDYTIQTSGQWNESISNTGSASTPAGATLLLATRHDWYQDNIALSHYNNATVINESGVDRDFRVESDSNTHALFVDASENRVFAGGLSSGSVGTAQFIVNAGQIGDAVNDTLRLQQWYYGTGNGSFFGHKAKRVSANGVWTGVEVNTVLEVDNSADIYKYITYGIPNITINEDSNDMDFRVESNNNTSMLFVDAGNDHVSIGTSSPIVFSDAYLQIEGPAAGWGLGITVNSTSTGNGGIGVTMPNSNDPKVLRIDKTGLGTIGTITTSGSTTAYNTSSDYRLKDVDGPITNSGAYIDALKPVQGSWKADGSRFIGLIAHEVQEVSETQIATGEKDGEEMQGMDYSAPELIANLIAEIQSLRARVHALESK